MLKSMRFCFQINVQIPSGPDLHMPLNRPLFSGWWCLLHCPLEGSPVGKRNSCYPRCYSMLTHLTKSPSPLTSCQGAGVYGHHNSWSIGIIYQCFNWCGVHTQIKVVGFLKMFKKSINIVYFKIMFLHVQMK